MDKKADRIERDSMGEMRVPAGAYYGAQTQRAVLNFPISGKRFPRRFIQALGIIKSSAAEINHRLGHLPTTIFNAINQASLEVASGKWDDMFVVDIFQTGSGTSTNMNANEVIARRASEILDFSESTPVHPNDHVNFGQSSNDVIPTAIHISTLCAIHEDLAPALRALRDSLGKKSEAFSSVLKSGRTHLMDATPISLGQEFGGFATQISHGLSRLETLDRFLGELPQGGTAVGTGINTDPAFPKAFAECVSKKTKLAFREAENHFEANSSRDACVEASSMFRTVAISLFKIATDIRWMASGPRCGFSEISIPAVQPGSSIMPGKLNPVIAEALSMVVAQVIGNDACIAFSASTANFQLNVMMPIIAHNLLESASLLTNACRTFQERCIDGIEANVDNCRQSLANNLSVCTALAPHIGYDKAASLSKIALSTGRSIREVALDSGAIDEVSLDRVLNLMRMTHVGIPDGF